MITQQRGAIEAIVDGIIQLHIRGFRIISFAAQKSTSTDDAKVLFKKLKNYKYTTLGEITRRRLSGFHPP